jgi:hypothetical protein
VPLDFPRIFGGSFSAVVRSTAAPCDMPGLPHVHGDVPRSRAHTPQLGPKKFIERLFSPPPASNKPVFFMTTPKRSVSMRRLEPCDVKTYENWSLSSTLAKILLPEA